MITLAYDILGYCAGAFSCVPENVWRCRFTELSVHMQLLLLSQACNLTFEERIIEAPICREGESNVILQNTFTCVEQQ
jgi:hypothetical protein